jgi:ABC-type multidrug transport system ATPase subunit
LATGRELTSPISSTHDTTRPAGLVGYGDALTLTALSKRWPRTVSPVLDEVTLSLAPGTATRLTGRNGAGKTTLLRIAAGLIRADSGSVGAFGLDPFTARREFQSRVGYLSAGSGALYARLTPRDHLELQAALALLPRRARTAAVEQELDRFSLHDLASRRTDRLSMGQRQRLRVALTLLGDRDLLLLDEPQTSLDDEGAELLAHALGDRISMGGAVLWCSPHRDDLGIELQHSYEIAGGRLWAE